jgi:glycine cleavage system regulatory protein
MKQLISLAITQFLIVAVVNAKSPSALAAAAKPVQQSHAGLSESRWVRAPEETAVTTAQDANAWSSARNETEEPVVKISDGTEVEIELANTLSGQEAKVGDVVDFTVLRDVTANGITVFERGASARARVTTAKKAGRWGRAGKLEWVMQDVRAVDGKRITARFTKRYVEQSKGAQVAIGAVATSVLVGPWSLFWGLKKGKPAIIPAGNRYIVFVHGDVDIKGKVPKQ